MNNHGWICLHRDIQAHWLFNFNESDKALAWIDLLLLASHEDNKFMAKGRVVECRRGQIAMSQITLQKRWKMSQNKLKRFLVLLKNDGMIELETNDLTTIITICNYNKYQDNERADGRPLGRPDGRGTDDQSDDKQQLKQLNNLTNKEKHVSLIDEKKAPILEIFEYWKLVMTHKAAKLDAKREKVISDALKIGYSIDQLKAAILGCSLTPFNCGKNDRNTRFDGLGIIFKSADQIDRFIQNSIQPPVKQTSQQQTVDKKYKVLN
jgi:hypothetical protein